MKKKKKFQQKTLLKQSNAKEFDSFDFWQKAQLSAVFDAPCLKS